MTQRATDQLRASPKHSRTGIQYIFDNLCTIGLNFSTKLFHAVETAGNRNRMKQKTGISIHQSRTYFVHALNAI